ncbi:MAG: matrixin family metalloprotease [Candidatus Obscuribacterales bacterium]
MRPARLTVLVIALMIYSLVAMLPSRAASEPALKGMALFNKGKYKEAYPLFVKAAGIDPRDPSIQYYLGISALYAEDPRRAQMAMTKVLLWTNDGNPYNRRAVEAAKQYHWPQPWRNNLYRWSEKAMPVKIYISDGRILPSQYVGHPLNPQSRQEIAELVRKPGYVERLPRVPAYNSGYRSDVISGLSIWEWARAEGFLSWKFINDPTKADIIVFWWPGKGNLVQGFTNGPGGLNQPAIMQISIPPDNYIISEKLRTVSGHEFGHAWGLEHSPVKEHLMHSSGAMKAIGPGRYEAKRLAEEEKATLRALYDSPARLYFFSVADRK